MRKVHKKVKSAVLGTGFRIATVFLLFKRETKLLITFYTLQNFAH